MKQHHMASVVVFLGCVIAASFSSTPVGIAIVGAGAFVSALFLLYPAIEKLTDKKGTGELSFSPAKGVTISWEVRSDQPIRTVIPENPTDSTKNQKAKALCDQGRSLVKRKTKDKNADLKSALNKFKEAAELDKDYWEPRVNIAQIYLLTGRLEEAFSEAESIRLVFSSEPLAYAKAGLILARVIEQGLSKDDSAEVKRDKYQVVNKILERNLDVCKGHLTSMISLGRAKILAGADDSEMSSYIKDAMQYKGFKDEFKKSLEREKMLDKFNESFPTLLEKNDDDN